MAKVTSDVGVCNLALSNISQEAIVSITSPKDTNEIICSKWYDTSRRKSLTLAEWNFAKGQSLLVQNTEAPPFGYDNQFALPSDYLKLNFIGETRQEFVRIYNDYSIVGNMLQINFDQDTGLPLTYTKDLKLVGLFPAWFLDVQALQLALDISPEINRTATEIQQLQQRLEAAIKTARELDGQESKVIITSSNNILTGRNQRIRRGNEIQFTTDS